jgi:hypothetical protein
MAESTERVVETAMAKAKCKHESGYPAFKTWLEGEDVGQTHIEVMADMKAQIMFLHTRLPRVYFRSCGILPHNRWTMN